MTRAEIAAAFGIHALEACLNEGTVTRVLPGVYVSNRQARDREARVRAAIAWAGNRGVLTGAAALWVYGCADRPPPVVTVLVPPDFKRRTPGWLHLRRTQVLPGVRHVKRLRVVSPAHAIVHAWNSSFGDAAIGTVVRAAVTMPVTSDELVAAAQATPRVRSRRELLALVELMDGGITSFLEHRARTRVFAGREFSHLQWQVRVLAQGTERYLDAYDERALLALEFDGEAFHSGESALQRDSTRDAQIATLGIQVLRFTYRDVMERPQWCQHTYSEVRRARLRGLGGGQ